LRWNSDADVSLAALASDAGLSRFHFCRAYWKHGALHDVTWPHHGPSNLSGNCDLFFSGAIVAASHADAGRTEQARTTSEHLRKLYPRFRVSSLQDWIAIRRPERLARFETGLRMAGLSE
jgi:hypothetical protein